MSYIYLTLPPMKDSGAHRYTLSCTLVALRESAYTGWPTLHRSFLTRPKFLPMGIRNDDWKGKFSLMGSFELIDLLRASQHTSRKKVIKVILGRNIGVVNISARHWLAYTHHCWGGGSGSCIGRDWHRSGPVIASKHVWYNNLGVELNISSW